jgi:hypothetical protein
MRSTNSHMLILTQQAPHATLEAVARFPDPWSPLLNSTMKLFDSKTMSSARFLVHVDDVLPRTPMRSALIFASVFQLVAWHCRRAGPKDIPRSPLAARDANDLDLAAFCSPIRSARIKDVCLQACTTHKLMAL